MFKITWRPYYLNYNASSSHSVDKRELREKKLSGMSAERVAAMTQHVAQMGHSVGINFNPGGKIGTTRDAHRLIHLTQTTKPPDVQNALVEKLFEAFHELEKDISSKEVLREIAVDAGISGPEVEEWLHSDLGGDIVDVEARVSRRDGLGVPRFMIQGVYSISGAQDSQEFLEIFVKVKEDEVRV